ncbi:MAG: protein-L-isoaspartate(D-aspartate) O-methyltransferase [Planctomycetota bacterium]
MEEEAFKHAREALVREGIEGRGVTDPIVLKAMLEVRRHLFVPQEIRHLAYENRPQSIGYQQTISQPYIVALMSEALALPLGPVEGAEVKERRRPKVLEVGTGSGYQAAVLDAMGAEVYSIEIIEPLARRAEKLLAELGYKHVHVRVGDGYRGWPEEAPFDGIIVTAAPDQVPEPLKEQLAEGGRLVVPVGDYYNQYLLRLTRRGDRFEQENLGAVIFVRMTGEAEDK